MGGAQTEVKATLNRASEQELREIIRHLLQYQEFDGAFDWFSLQHYLHRDLVITLGEYARNLGLQDRRDSSDTPRSRHIKQLAVVICSNGTSVLARVWELMHMKAVEYLRQEISTGRSALKLGCARMRKELKELLAGFFIPLEVVNKDTWPLASRKTGSRETRWGRAGDCTTCS